VSDAAADDILLETRGLARSFRGFMAVDGVDLRVRRGAIHALIGPNGAGKTTCFNLLTRFLDPSAGSIHFKGRDITRERPAQVARQGMTRSFQISAVFLHMTVLENVRVGLQRKLGTCYHFWKPVSTLAAIDGEAMRLLEQVGLAAFAHLPAGQLPYGRKRALELATTLAMDPELLLLDEPSSGMGHEDVELVIRLVREAARGRTVLMVEHNMGIVAGLCDRITVLQRGNVLAEGNYADISRNPAVIEAYMGTPESSTTEQTP
jgi:branched-chain amino acid transport system ATP-binding protein